MLKLATFLITAAGVLSLMLILAVLFAYPTMWLVNYLFSPVLLTSVFGISQLTLFKAALLNLFVGFSIRRSSSSD